jgi:hypothetical protein
MQFHKVDAYSNLGLTGVKYNIIKKSIVEKEKFIA